MQRTRINHYRTARVILGQCPTHAISTISGVCQGAVGPAYVSNTSRSNLAKGSIAVARQNHSYNHNAVRKVGVACGCDWQQASSHLGVVILMQPFKSAPSRSVMWTPCIIYLGPHESAPQTASRSVLPFLHSWRLCPTHTCDICNKTASLLLYAGDVASNMSFYCV